MAYSVLEIQTMRIKHSNSSGLSDSCLCYSRFNKLFITLTMAGMLLLSSTGYSQRILLDKVVAIVDEDVVLQSELDARLIDITRQAELSGQELPKAEDLRQDILDLLVVENLQMQFANRINIRFDDDTLNRVLGSMAEQSNMTFDDYIAALESNGVYRQTREQVRKEMTLRDLQRGVVNSRIAITDQEIENFLNSENGKEIMSADYLLDHLLIATSSADSPEQINEKLKYAAELVAQIEAEGNMGSTRIQTQNRSLFPVSSTEFGWRKKDQYPSLFADLLEDLDDGEIAGPIRAGNGFHIIQLVQKRGGTQQIVNQTHIRHIMLIPNEIRDEAQTIAALATMRQQIIDGESFSTLARQNSDDASSVVAGGDLDWINERGMPPEMEAVIEKLEINQLSEPFESETGWHIAEVMGRRESDLSLQYGRAQAENALRNRKFDLELENWMIEIREEAFVEFVE
ncbi:MAG: hypothetical protein COC19_03315 [SAR86 cluster bacterium]|uniref:Chaperone SurA n=1 Tax=SAR86 cluster bacterium TaxID=2030880 RepID=A0A2A4MR12_9GAMM|nr:MAG: hypothetical protein COC19_03315 [SAR86 cluster bacterium]